MKLVTDTRTGVERQMQDRYARIFERLGRGRYLTRDMAPFVDSSTIEAGATPADTSPELFPADEPQRRRGRGKKADAAPAQLLPVEVAAADPAIAPVVASSFCGDSAADESAASAEAAGE